MSVRLTLVMLACAARAWAQDVPAPKLTEAERKKLESNGVLVRERQPTDNRGVSAEAVGVVDAPPDEVWPVVRDCEHFSKFLPSTKSSAKKIEQGAWVCFDEISLPFPLTNLWADTKSLSQETPGGPYQRTWSLVRGTYRRNQGSWTVLPWGDGQRSLVIYFIDSEPSMAVPDFILKSAQTGSMPEVIIAVRKRVVALRANAAKTP